jgi:hypothetical protein
MLVKFENGVKDVDLLEVTKENYIVPQGEEKVYHVLIEQRKFDPNTGKRLSRPRIQKFGKKMFESLIQQNLPMQGYTLDILWNPNTYLQQLEEQKKIKAAEQKAKAEAKMQEKIEAAVDAALQKKSGKKKSNDNE